MKHIARANLRAFVGAALALPLLVVASCGVDSNTLPAGSQESTLEEWKTQPRAERFTQAEIDSVYTTATKVVGGKTFPDSKTPLKFIYNATNAPAKFKTEYGNFNAGAEIKGYLNLGYVPAGGFQSRLISNFEKLSTWKTIKDSTGKTIFSDSYTTDERGTKISDWSDGLAGANGETHFGTLALQTNTPIGSVNVPSSVVIYNRDGEMQVDVVNVKDVRAPIVGTVIKSGGLKIHLKMFPHEKGWLVYGAAAVKLEKFEDAMKPEDLSRYIDSLFTWIKDNTVVAL